MVGAVLAGDGLERVAEIASAHAGAPVAVIVPRLGGRWRGGRVYERYVGARLAGGQPAAPGRDHGRGADLLGRAASSGPCCCSGRGRPTRASTCTWRRSPRSPRWRWWRPATRPSSRCAARSSRSCSRAPTSTRPTCSAAPRGSAATCRRVRGALRRPHGRGPGRLSRSLAAELPGRARPAGGRQGVRAAARVRRIRRAGWPTRLGRHADGRAVLLPERRRRGCAARWRRRSWCWA